MAFGVIEKTLYPICKTCIMVKCTKLDYLTVTYEVAGNDAIMKSFCSILQKSKSVTIKNFGDK